MIAGGSFSGMVEPSAGSEHLEKNAVSLERDIETSPVSASRDRPAYLFFLDVLLLAGS